MIRLNRTYDSFMIDLVLTNEKLNKRAIKIVSGLCKSQPKQLKKHKNMQRPK